VAVDEIEEFVRIGKVDTVKGGILDVLARAPSHLQRSLEIDSDQVAAGGIC
jgi:hypothetical protein